MLLHQKIEVTDDMQQNLFAEDRLQKSLSNQREEVWSWIVSHQK